MSAAQVPVDLVTASASGLDPDISVPARADPGARASRGRAGSTPARVRAARAQPRAGPRRSASSARRRVNVLGLNLALDALLRSRP